MFLSRSAHPKEDQEPLGCKWSWIVHTSWHHLTPNSSQASEFRMHLWYQVGASAIHDFRWRNLDWVNLGLLQTQEVVNLTNCKLTVALSDLLACHISKARVALFVVDDGSDPLRSDPDFTWLTNEILKRPSTSLLREFATNIWTNKKDWTEVDLRWEQRPLWWYSILGSVLWKQSLKELKWYVTNCYKESLWTCLMIPRLVSQATWTQSYQDVSTCESEWGQAAKSKERLNHFLPFLSPRIPLQSDVSMQAALHCFRDWSPFTTVK